MVLSYGTYVVYFAMNARIVKYLGLSQPDVSVDQTVPAVDTAPPPEKLGVNPQEDGPLTVEYVELEREWTEVTETDFTVNPYLEDLEKQDSQATPQIFRG